MAQAISKKETTQTAVDYLIEMIRLNDKEFYAMLFEDGVLQQAKQIENEQRKEYERKLINDFSIKVTEYLLKPPFNLEHAQHGIACEKLAILRNNFSIEHHNKTYNK